VGRLETWSGAQPEAAWTAVVQVRHYLGDGRHPRTKKRQGAIGGPVLRSPGKPIARPRPRSGPRRSFQSVEASKCPSNRHKSPVLKASTKYLSTLLKVASCPTAIRVSTLRRFGMRETGPDMVLTKEPPGFAPNATPMASRCMSWRGPTFGCTGNVGGSGSKPILSIGQTARTPVPFLSCSTAQSSKFLPAGHPLSGRSATAWMIFNDR